MRWTRASERAVKGWISGKGGPSGEHLIPLMAYFDAVFAAVLRVTGRQRATRGRQFAAISPPSALPIWRVAGFLTGALPALVGGRQVHVTIDAVETFVDHHYQQQIDRLDAEGLFPELRALLPQCHEDEVEHRDEARDLHGGGMGWLLRAWGWVVGSGSAAAVAAAKRV